jgi:hypothetical protein
MTLEHNNEKNKTDKKVFDQKYRREKYAKVEQFSQMFKHYILLMTADINLVI